MVVVTFKLGRGVLGFDEPSWLYHFGRRALHGEVPYRDFVVRSGPLPIYVEALFQSVLGERYLVSLSIALLISVVRVLVMWAIARRIAGRGAAAALAVFVGLDAAFASGFDSVTSYAELLVTVSGLFFWLASRAEARRVPVFLALAGFQAGAIVTVEPDTGVIVGLVLMVSTSILLARKHLTLRTFLALGAGFAAAVLMLLLVLALQGTLGAALGQAFVAPFRSSPLGGIDTILDPIFRGAAARSEYGRVRNLLLLLGVPIVAVGAVHYFAAHATNVSRRSLAIGVLVLGVCLGMMERYLALDLISDLPRMFVTSMIVLALVSPARLKQWFGVDPLVVIGFGALALAADWATSLSTAGRGGGDAPALVTAVILVTIASEHLQQRTKTVLCVLFAVAGLVQVGLRYAEAADRASPTLRGNATHVLAETRMPRWRRQSLEWIAGQVEPGSTCFVDGNAPVLYDLLDCNNPTHYDIVVGGMVTEADDAAMIAALTAGPPDYVIVDERKFGLSLGALLGQYEPLGSVGEVLGAGMAGDAARSSDGIDALRIYRLRR